MIFNLLNTLQTINFADRLLELIPHLWDEAEGDWHFRGAILSMLAKLVAVSNLYLYFLLKIN